MTGAKDCVDYDKYTNYYSDSSNSPSLFFQVMSKQTQVKGIDANEKEGEGGQIGRASLRRLRKVSNVE